MSGPTDYSRLKVIPDADTQEWWEGVKQKKYLVRQCNQCGHKWFPPWPVCSKCTSIDVGWFTTSGRGIVYSYVVVEQPILAAFANAVPYVVALIELPDCAEADGETIRVSGALLDDEDKVAIGLPVEVVYEETPDPDILIPRWRIAGTDSDAWKFSG